MRTHLIPPALAAALAARARRPAEVAQALYLPAYDHRLDAPPSSEAADDEVDASGITIGDDADDDFY